MHKLHTKTSTGYLILNLKGAKTCVLLTNLADLEETLNDKPGIPVMMVLTLKLMVLALVLMVLAIELTVLALDCLLRIFDIRQIYRSNSRGTLRQKFNLIDI